MRLSKLGIMIFGVLCIGGIEGAGKKSKKASAGYVPPSLGSLLGGAADSVIEYFTPTASAEQIGPKQTEISKIGIVGGTLEKSGNNLTLLYASKIYNINEPTATRLHAIHQNKSQESVRITSTDSSHYIVITINAATYRLIVSRDGPIETRNAQGRSRTR